MSELEKIRILPLLPLKNSVLFPGLLMPLSVGRTSSLAAVEAAVATEDKEIIVVAQRDASADTPGAADLFTIGTRAAIRKVARPKKDHIDILAFGLERVVIVKVNEEGGHFSARYHPLPAPDDSSRETEALTLSIVEMGTQVHGADPIAAGFSAGAGAIVHVPGRSAAAGLHRGFVDEPGSRAGTGLARSHDARRSAAAGARLAVARSRSAGAAQQDHRGCARRNVAGAERIHPAAAEESHRAGIGREESATRPKSSSCARSWPRPILPEDVRKEAERELGRLEKLPPSQPEHNVIRTWLEYVIELPWNKRSDDNLDLARARQVLDEDHFGLTKVKERILEHLAVLKLNPEAKAPILCFVGAPGVGKTSLGQSIARALGRKFERMSLGGLHDEAELRGHRRTYIGALPGRLAASDAARWIRESGADAG